MRRVLGAVVVAAVFAAGVAGCGDDDSTTEETTTASLTKEEFVAQANEICAASSAELEAAAQEAFPNGQPTPEELEPFATETLLPAIEGQLQAIGELPVPEGEEENVAEVLDAANQGLEEAQADPAALSSGQSDPFAEANQLAADYGMTECA